MKRRNVLAGVLTLCISSCLFVATASASVARARPAVEGPPCLVHSLPSFVDQGEFAAEHASVADVIEVECKATFSGHTVKISAAELGARCKLFWIHGHSPVAISGGSAVSGIKLDGAGNAEVAFIGGPSCTAGEVTISAHLEEAPFTTVTAPYTVLPPHTTKPGVEVKGATNQPKQVVDEFDGSLFAIVQVEFPSVYAELQAEVAAEQLFARCTEGPKLVWFTEGAKLHKIEGVESVRLKLDNDGNAFALVDAEESCAKGLSTIEAMLVPAPHTRFTTEFEVEPAHETF